MSKTKIQQSFINLENALARLKEALLENSKNPLIIDGTIQRFEFVIELFWKTFKRILNDEGIETATPKEALKAAYHAGWLQNETIWLQMLQDRNETSHVYSQAKAQEIYNHIKNNFTELEQTFTALKQRFENQTLEGDRKTK